MSRPITDRIKEQIAAGRQKEAILLCREVKDEFLFLHDLYMNMILSTYSFIAERAGELKLGDALSYQYEKAVLPLAEKVKPLSWLDMNIFLALKVFGVDNCNQTGLPKGRFTMEETDEDVVFTLDPCGSGGRLFRGGAYNAMSRSQKGLERLVDAFYTAACKFLPLPDKLLKWAFADTGGYITQRKPYGQGRTKSEHSWSFDSKNMPYFCCQCGMLQEKLGDSCLKIVPPRTPSSPCLWPSTTSSPA